MMLIWGRGVDEMGVGFVVEFELQAWRLELTIGSGSFCHSFSSSSFRGNLFFFGVSAFWESPLWGVVQNL